MGLQGIARASLAAGFGALAFAAPAGAASVIETVAGTPGQGGSSGDGGPAKTARLAYPDSLSLAPDGSFLIAGAGHRIRRVSTAQVISTVAGTGAFGSSGDGGPATQAKIFPAYDVMHTSGDGFLIATGVSGIPGPFLELQIRRVESGTISTMFDASSTPSPKPASIYDMAQTADGGTLIADSTGNRIWKAGVTPSGGLTFTVVAGNGTGGAGGDGGPATAAQLNSPGGVAVQPDGSFLVADTYNHKIRKVANGIITTVAGTGQEGSTAHCKSPAQANLSAPEAIAVTAQDRFLIADRGNDRIMEVVQTAGTGRRIVTVAGSGEAGYSGDVGIATQARLHNPHDVVTTPDGGFLIADTENHVVRRVTRDPNPEKLCGLPTQPPPTPGPPPLPNPGDLVGVPPVETPPTPSAEELVAAVERLVGGLPLPPVGGLPLPPAAEQVVDRVRRVIAGLLAPDDGAPGLPIRP